ncbi:MAG: VWA domain-containing protein, partial [Chthoniobacterales bacterium]|nr:VWA domain-containing protein [Chthoniobacterales bacterium]
LLLGVGLALVSLARPRWGHTYEDIKRKGLDLIVAVDTSRSMLANDVPPNRLQRVKLAAQDLINELRGDRIGLIAFAGRAFLQAPLTIDYDAAVEALNDLDTNTIPEGGTNISEAINLAVQTFGKSAVGNRALIIFTDGEELAGDSAKIAQTAADAGVRIFSVGVGTPEGSLIPLPARGGGTAFVKDSSGQVVKSKLDEKRLRDIAESTGGTFLPLGNGPATMKRLYSEGLSQMQAGDIDARTSRHPIERYQWPLGAAIISLGASLLISARKRARRRARPVPPRAAPVAAATAMILLLPTLANAAAPGLAEYRNEKYPEAYERFQQTLKEHPETRAADKIQFDSGAAAYKMKDYGKALQSFSQALLSPDLQLQSRSHYNLGNTLYQRGETQKGDEQKLKDWTNALQHYEQTLKLEPENKEAKENYEFVKNKIEELKKKQEQQPSPTPTPSPSPQDKKDQKKQDKDNSQEQDKNKQQQQQEQSGEGDEQKPEQGQDQSQKNDKSENKGEQQMAGESPSPTPSPSPSPGETPDAKAGSSPSPSPGQEGQSSPTPGGQAGSPSPSPGEGKEGPSPSPSPGEADGGEGENKNPTPAGTPAGTPGKKPSGEVKGASEDQPQENAENTVEAEPVEEGKMSEQQAERLLRAMKDEEARVQLDEHKAVRRVYNDW